MANPPSGFGGHRAGVGDHARSAAQWALRDRQLPRRPGQPLLVELDPKTKQVVWTFDQYETFGNSVSNSQILGAGGEVLR